MLPVPWRENCRKGCAGHGLERVFIYDRTGRGTKQAGLLIVTLMQDGTKDVLAYESDGPEKTEREFRSLIAQYWCINLIRVCPAWPGWICALAGSCTSRARWEREAAELSETQHQKVLKGSLLQKYRGSFLLQSWTHENLCAVGCSLVREWCFFLSIGSSLPLAQKHTWKQSQK